MKQKKMMHLKPGMDVLNGKIVKTIDPREVVLMAISGNWSMVRRPSCIPYTCPIKELVDTTSTIIVPDNMPAGEANAKYGESYGVDWKYEGRKPATTLK